MLEGGARGKLGLDIDDQLAYLQSIDEVKATKIIALKRFNQTQRPETQNVVVGDLKVVVGLTPFSDSPAWIGGVLGNMEIHKSIFFGSQSQSFNITKNILWTSTKISRFVLPDGKRKVCQ